MLLINVLGADPLAGVLAIALPYGAISAKVYADLLDEAPREAYAALIAGGSGRLRAYVYGLLPYVGPDMLSYALYRFDCAVRSAVVLGIVGAGGLGLLLDAAFHDLDGGQLWTCVYALVLLCGAAAWGSDVLRRRTARAAVRADGGIGRDRGLWAVGALVVAGTVWALWYLRADPATLWSPAARDGLRYVLTEAWPPLVDTAFLADVGRLALETLEMSVVATAVAAAVAVPLAPLAARPRTGRHGPRRRAVGVVVRGALLLARAVPAPVWVLVLLFVMLPGPLPGALALAVHTAGVVGRLCAEVVENADPAPAQALRAAGARPVQVFVYGVLPPCVPRFGAFTLYRWELTVRDTVVVGLVGGGGLGYLLGRQVAAFDWPAVTTTLVVLIALAFVVDMVSASVRAALR